jgi:predicted RNase H-like HicB family nuclease
MCIDWSPVDEIFIARFPGVPFVRTHGATHEEAAERGEELIVAWLTGMKDAGHSIAPPKIRV